MLIEKLVELVVEAKSKNEECDTSSFERKIDLVVYDLYGLSKSQIKLIENHI